MAGKILVALKSQDRLYQVLPYVEEVAQPGMKVIFLIRFAPTGVSEGSRDNSVTLKPPEEVEFVGDLEQRRRTDGQIRGTQSMEEQRLLAEHKAFLTEEALRKRGIEIAVDVYTGSLKRVVRSYTRDGDVHLIMMRAGRFLLAMMRVLNRAMPILGLFKRPAFPPMLLLHPNHAA